jgi:hypothetical protein
LENSGQAKPNKLYGVDGDGKCYCFFLQRAPRKKKKKKLILLLATLFNRTHSPLQVFKQLFNLLNFCEEKIPGIHIPYIYGGTPGTFFGWHLEDFQLFSANYQLDGAAKVWYTIPAYYLENVVQYELGECGARKDIKITSLTILALAELEGIVQALIRLVVARLRWVDGRPL